MSDGKSKNNFKSYLELNDLQNVDDEADDALSALKPKLLSGEQIVAEVPKVLLFAPASENKQGLLGILSVTNFKLSFITTQQDNEEEQHCQQNLLLGVHEVCLLNVDLLFSVIDKKRKLICQKVPDKIKELVVVCKNFRVLSFSFKFSPVDSGKKIATALLHHSSPLKHYLLFAYEYKEPYYSSCGSVRMFREHRDWEYELERTGVSKQYWRVSKANEHFQLSPILPYYIVVPYSVLDHQLYDAARHFRNGCSPLWVWGSPNGAALLRMSDIEPSISDRVQENVMLENIRKCHPNMRQPVVLDLSKECPSLSNVFDSFKKLRDLSTPDSLRQFWLQDKNFNILLDNSRWLHSVSVILQKAQLATKFISDNGETVVLQEGDGRDMCCVVSSLIQLFLDPFWRTITGFQTLIQKEWVALGHRFASRLGHIKNSAHERSPIFLLFLDCVWQILQQYPQAFEFTETYLTTLWDSAHMSIFDTFLFDCERKRKLASMDPTHTVILRSVWDWHDQFNEKDIALFQNPLFDSGFREVLRPNCTIPYLEIWTQCYFRWIPLLEVPNGGKPHIDLFNRWIVSNINNLQQTLLNSSDESNGLERDTYTINKLKVNSFFPFSHNDMHLTGLNNILSLNNSMFASEVMTLDSQSVLNIPD